MKRFFLFTYLFISVFAKAQIFFGTIVSDFPPINWSGHTTVFIGNSIVLGNIGPSDNAHRWTTLFSGVKGTTESNFGISGQMMCANTCPKTTFNKTTIPVYNSSTHAALIFCIGINDIGNNQGGTITSTLFKSTYVTAIDYAINTRGWPPSKIVLITPTWANSYSTYVGGCSGTNILPDVTRQTDFNTKVQEVAAQFGTRFVDLYTPMKAALNSTYFAVDGLHPNDLGDAWIASYLEGVIN